MVMVSTILSSVSRRSDTALMPQFDAGQGLAQAVEKGPRLTFGWVWGDWAQRLSIYFSARLRSMFCRTISAIADSLAPCRAISEALWRGAP